MSDTEKEGGVGGGLCYKQVGYQLFQLGDDKSCHLTHHRADNLSARAGEGWHGCVDLDRGEQTPFWNSLKNSRVRTKMRSLSRLVQVLELLMLLETCGASRSYKITPMPRKSKAARSTSVADGEAPESSAVISLEADNRR